MTDMITFASTTPRHGMPLLYVGQAQKEVTVNEAILACDFLIDRTIQGVASAPPASPGAGMMWLVGKDATGGFSGKSDHLAGWSEGGWRFFAPQEGMRVFDRSLSACRYYLQAWAVPVAPAAPSGGAMIDEEVRAALAQLCDALKSAGILSPV